MRRLVAICGSAGFLLGCLHAPNELAPGPAPTKARQCFDLDRVDNFRSGGWDKIYVRSRPERAVYELNGLGCRGLDFAFQLGLVADGGSGRRACVGDQVRVINPSVPAGQSLCRVRVDRALTTAEVEALPSAQRP